MLSAVLGVTSILFVGDSLVASQYFWLREALVEQGYRCAESAARHHAEGSVKHSLCSGNKKKPDSPFNGLQKFKWGSSAVARAKAQAKIGA